jgi:hypothetical protein
MHARTLCNIDQDFFTLETGQANSTRRSTHDEFATDVLRFDFTQKGEAQLYIQQLP